jgi:hypothetical protein
VLLLNGSKIELCKEERVVPSHIVVTVLHWARLIINFLNEAPFS